MLFSSTIFLFGFLPIVLTLYFLLPGTRARNGLLLTASLLFYAWGETAYVGLLLSSIAFNYAFGLAIANARRRDGVVLGLGVAANLLLLGAFKYAAFFAEALGPVLAPLGLPAIEVGPVHLPIGISFFTFQAITYLVDVRRGDAPVQSNPLRVALYISLFPQLVAGPIVRYREIAAAIASRTSGWEDVGEGARLFVVGLGKKVLIADTLAGPADAIFGAPAGSVAFGLTWLGVLCFSLQIYFDFAGYSDMAIGLGRIFGFRFPENFRHPYVSLSLREFWRRWHITLSTWFRDYLYVPLGGNRMGTARTHLNLFTVFLLCGLWHGASFNFVIWGAIHGAVMVAERHGLAGALARLGRPAQRIVTLGVIGVAWVFFRSETLPDALLTLQAMAGAGSASAALSAASLLSPPVCLALAVGVLGSTPWLEALRERLESVLSARPDSAWRRADQGLSALRIVALQAVLVLCAMELAAGTHDPFIYFRF